MILGRARGWAIALLVGCAQRAPAPATPPRTTPMPLSMPPSFICRGPEPWRAPDPEPAPAVASGRLVVQRLPLPPAASPAREDEAQPLPFGGVRLRVVAEAIPLPRFAAALAEAVRVSVVVPPEAFGFQVTLAAPDVTADALLRALGRLGLTWDLDPGGWLRLQPREMSIALFERALTAHHEPTETIVFAPVPGVPFDELARLLCDQVASPRGRVDLVAGHLVVQDVQRQMDQFRQMVDAIPAPATAPPVGFSCHGPASAPIPPRAHRPMVPSGRLVIRRLPLPDGAPDPRGEDEPPSLLFAGVRLRVLAEAIPLGPFAVALSEALQVGVAVPPRSHDLQVTFASSDVTVDRLLRALRAVGVESDLHPSIFSLEAADPSGSLVRPARAGEVCLAALETRVVPPTAGVPFDHVARYFCDRLASDRGMAHVVAGRLVVHDYPGRINQVERLIRALTPSH